MLLVRRVEVSLDGVVFLRVRTLCGVIFFWLVYAFIVSDVSLWRMIWVRILDPVIYGLWVADRFSHGRVSIFHCSQ